MRGGRAAGLLPKLLDRIRQLGRPAGVSTCMLLAWLQRAPTCEEHAREGCLQAIDAAVDAFARRLVRQQQAAERVQRRLRLRRGIQAQPGAAGRLAGIRRAAALEGTHGAARQAAQQNCGTGGSVGGATLVLAACRRKHQPACGLGSRWGSGRGRQRRLGGGHLWRRTCPSAAPGPAPRGRRPAGQTGRARSTPPPGHLGAVGGKAG